MAESLEGSSEIKTIYLNLAWLDANIPSAENQNTLRRFHKNFGRCRTFHDLNKATISLKQFSSSRLAIVVSGQFAKALMENIHDMSDLESVYIYCGKVDLHRPLQQTYSKVNLDILSLKIFCKVKICLD